MRHRVVVPGDLDVVVDAGSAFVPLGILTGPGREGLEGRLVDLLEQFEAAGAEVT